MPVKKENFNKVRVFIETLTLGPLSSNCYLVYEKDDHQGIVIDPADEADYIVQRIQKLGFIPKALVTTHGHFDHVGAVLDLKLVYKIPYFASQKDIFLTKRASRSSKFFTNNQTLEVPSPDKNLKEGQIINFGSSSLTVLETPGHTPGSISLVGKGFAFVGDLIFGDGSLGRTDLSYTDRHLLEKSINKIKKLPKETILYPGHGRKFRLKEIGY